ncbi:phosphotransferase [Halalkalibacter urbisdiaboli]|uniref:phosphotransferase n=1 Tax=Halalkalibacter urbisdiaboli TaxID=1960589 RepID=UPI000B4486EE|nr:phosphotransferase [Halalkalibacter urbisdiaboli]
MNSVTNKSIRDDIFEAINNIFGFNIIKFSKIELGHMNLKWHIKTDIGDLFVKQYNKTRYPEQMIQGLETSLNHQNNLYNEGIPCPELYSHKGNYVMKSSYGERFVLMGLCEGSNIKAGTANEGQMYSLGKVIGKMHKLLNSNKTVHLPLHWNVRSKESMIDLWKDRWNEAISLDCSNTLSKLEIQREIIEKNDVDIFSECEKGWGHWDLFVDNILFKTNSVSALLDFDRMHYVYPEFDISRPILSCCLEKGQIHINRVSAFVKGYQEYQALTNQKLVRSIKLTWWKEAEWLRANIQNSSPLNRFNEENTWVAENWDDLDSLFANIDFLE